jgi:hypothetical protein
MGVVGTLIGLGAAGVLSWNEWQLARTLGAIGAARASLVSLAADEVDTGTDAGPVHVVGEARAGTPARDPALGITAAGLRLDRTAETYQWLEHKEGSGDNKNLRYERVWSPVLIPSGRFERRTDHVNPKALRLASERFLATGARLGDLVLDETLVLALPATRELRPDARAPFAAQGLSFRREGDWLYSGEPASPKVGDVRLRLAVAPEGTVSMIGAVEAGRLVPWRAPNGGVVALADYGEVPAERLLSTAARGDWREAWALRGFGTLAMVVGVLFASPALAGSWGDRSAFRGRRRLGTILLLGIGLAATVCALGWLGARRAHGIGPLAA